MMGSIPDDPPTDCYGRCTKGRLFDGALSFAGGGPNSRDNQLFFVYNMADQPIGHELWEVPIGNVTTGLGVINAMYGGYGEKVDQVRFYAVAPAQFYLFHCTRWWITQVLS